MRSRQAMRWMKRRGEEGGGMGSLCRCELLASEGERAIC